MNEVQNRSDIKSGGKAAMLTIVVSYLLGTVILVFFLLTAVSARVNEQDAAGVTGQMRSYTVNDGIRLDDGTVYLVYRQNQTVEFEDDMSRLPPDTTVSLLVVPDPFNAAFHETTMYAVSVETENGVLLDLDAGLKAANASVLKMIVLCAAVLTLNMIALFCFACKCVPKRRVRRPPRRFTKGTCRQPGHTERQRRACAIACWRRRATRRIRSSTGAWARSTNW